MLHPDGNRSCLRGHSPGAPSKRPTDPEQCGHPNSGPIDPGLEGWLRVKFKQHLIRVEGKRARWKGQGREGWLRPEVSHSLRAKRTRNTSFFLFFLEKLLKYSSQTEKEEKPIFEHAIRTNVCSFLPWITKVINIHCQFWKTK